MDLDLRIRQTSEELQKLSQGTQLFEAGRTLGLAQGRLEVLQEWKDSKEWKDSLLGEQKDESAGGTKE